MRTPSPSASWMGDGLSSIGQATASSPWSTVRRYLPLLCAFKPSYHRHRIIPDHHTTCLLDMWAAFKLAAPSENNGQGFRSILPGGPHIAPWGSFDIYGPFFLYVSPPWAFQPGMRAEIHTPGVPTLATRACSCLCSPQYFTHTPPVHQVHIDDDFAARAKHTKDG